jgi:hypothetical protein
MKRRAGGDEKGFRNSEFRIQNLEVRIRGLVTAYRLHSRARRGSGGLSQRVLVSHENLKHRRTRVAKTFGRPRPIYTGAG